MSRSSLEYLRHTKEKFTTGHFYGCANLLAFWAGKDVICAVGFGNKTTATSCSIRNPRI